ncbi:MAG: hypothetical protein ACFB51_09680 [Anaerolineae bacterium]
MQVLKAVRYLAIVGAGVIVFSYPLRWAVFSSVTGVVTGTHPPAILFLGLALLILSLIPATPQFARIIPVVLVGASIVAVFIILWTGIETVLQIVQNSEIALGPGPIVAIVGVALFVVGAIAEIQVIDPALDDEAAKPYRITGTDNRS